MIVGGWGRQASLPKAIIISVPGHKYRYNHTEKTAGKQPKRGKPPGTLFADPGHFYWPIHLTCPGRFGPPPLTQFLVGAVSAPPLRVGFNGKASLAWKNAI